MLKDELGQRCTLVELDGVGHSVPVEAPDEVAAAMLAYLAKEKLAAA
jgi:pimeloyl-ACP methyl ester carboxylesterase